MNMRTVATRAGVSVATVSRVLSGSLLVRPETAQLVQNVIDELQFVPNTSATTLKYGRSDTFGVIIPDLTNPFFFEFLRDFENLLHQRNQSIMLANTEFQDRTASSVRRLLMNQVDGVVVMASDEEFTHYNRLAFRNIPVVTVDRRSIAPMISDVSFRYEQGMLQAAQHLYKLGHRRIGMIGGNEDLATSRVRKHAFCSALERTNVPTRTDWLRSGNYRVDGGDAEMRALIKLRERPTAIIAINDLTAFGAIRAAHALGLSVPQDVSIVGFDDIMLADIVSPALTTVCMPRTLLAQQCVQAFSDMATSAGKDGVQLWVETHLVVRKSTGAPASA